MKRVSTLLPQTITSPWAITPSTAPIPGPGVMSPAKMSSANAGSSIGRSPPASAGEPDKKRPKAKGRRPKFKQILSPKPKSEFGRFDGYVSPGPKDERHGIFGSAASLTRMDSAEQPLLNFDSENSAHGVSSWREQRHQAMLTLSRKLGLPLGRKVEVWLRNEIRLVGTLRLQEEQLFVPVIARPTSSSSLIMFPF